ncbi:MAG: ABC transporter permease, partial [Prevotellaceae bacterium]|nr:ABC transporter permease [Prevotellaceae bacterium]
MNNIFNFRAFLNYLKKNKIYTLINVFGLTASLTFVILIAVYVQQELSVDTFHRNADRIYVLGSDKDLEHAYRLAYAVRDRYPEIESVCPVIPYNFPDYTVLVDENKFLTKMLFTDSTFFDFFDFKLQGSKAHALATPGSAVISRTFARKAFGNEDPVGQIIRIQNSSLLLTVSGVIEDISNSVIPYGDIIVQSGNIRHFNSTMDSKKFSNAGGAYIFLMEKENACLQAKTEDMTNFFKEIFWPFIDNMKNTVTLTPLKKAYFSDIHGYLLRHGDLQFVTILLSVGLIILIFALINYINLTVAQSGFRAREMAVRRLLGASRSELFARMVVESTFLCFIAFVPAIFFAYTLLPYSEALLEIKQSLSGLLTPSGILFSIAVILILGMISGCMPAMIISRVKPLDVTKGSMVRKNKMVFSKYFIIFQHVITVILLVTAITVTSQTQYLINAPLGYNTDNIVLIH